MPAYSKKVPLPGRTAQEIYEKISVDLEQLTAKGGLPNARLSRDPANRRMELKSPMFDAVLVCLDGEIRLDAKLGLLALPFRSKLDEQIEKWVGRSFPS